MLKARVSSRIFLCLFLVLTGLNGYSQEKDTAYFFKRLNGLIAVKRTMSDSIFTVAEDIKNEVDTIPQLKAYIDLRVDYTIANYHYRQHKFSQSLEIYEKVRQQCLAINDTAFLTNIKESKANIYQYIGDHEKSIELFRDGLGKWVARNNTRMAARSARNISESYLAIEDFENAICYADSSLRWYKEQKDSNWIPESYFHKVYAAIELTREDQSKYSTEQLKIWLDTALSYVDPNKLYGLHHLKLLQGKVWLMENEYEKALEACNIAFEGMSNEELNTKSFVDQTCMCLAVSYDSLKNQDSSIHYLSLYKNYADSMALYNGDRMAHKTDLELGYKNKKTQEKLKNEARLKHEKAKREAFLAKQRTYWLLGGLCLVFVITVMVIIYRRSKRTKHLFMELAEHNKDLMDSIHYAERIQRSMLPVQTEMNHEFKDHFVLFKPKDVVAGDFYWMTEQAPYVFIAAADCTGHGVPGALVSLICHEALQQATQDFKLSETNAVLDKVRSLVKERLSISGDDIKDGMDIALCRLNKTTNELQFSGAYNPMWLIRDGELKVFKANRQPIGAYHDEKPFKSENIQLQKGDKIYLFSDGYADQFGGDAGKKLRTKNFKKLILEHSQNKMTTQLNDYQDFFNEWKGEYEQLDDVCLLGIEI